MHLQKLISKYGQVKRALNKAIENKLFYYLWLQDFQNAKSF